MGRSDIFRRGCALRHVSSVLLSQKPMDENKVQYQEKQSISELLLSVTVKKRAVCARLFAVLVSFRYR